jgi:hypothetical protein
MVNGHSELEERDKGSYGNHKNISLSLLGWRERKK